MPRSYAKRDLRFINVILLSFSTLYAGNEYTAKPGEQVVPGQVIVRLKSGVSAANVVSNSLSGSKIQPIGQLNTYVLSVAGGLSSSAISNLAQNPSVEYVEPNRIRYTTA